MTDLTPNSFPPDQGCGNCRFAGTHTSAVSPKEQTFVSCHRHPPQRLGNPVTYGVTLTDRANNTGWPTLTWDDWCGEWAKRFPRLQFEIDRDAERQANQ